MCREWLCELGRWGMAALRRWFEHRINDGRYGRRTVPAGGAVNTRHQEGSKLSRFKEQRKGQCLRNIVDEENGSGWGVRDRWGDDRPKHTEGDSIQAGRQWRREPEGKAERKSETEGVSLWQHLHCNNGEGQHGTANQGRVHPHVPVAYKAAPVTDLEPTELTCSFLGGSAVKNLPANPEDKGLSPWRRKWQLTPIFLPAKSHEQGNLPGYSPWCHKRVGHERATKQQQSDIVFWIFCR